MEFCEKSKLTNIKAGTFLKLARINKGMTGKALGDCLGVSQQQISRYERGQNNITLELLGLAFLHLDISWRDFFHFIFEK